MKKTLIILTVFLGIMSMVIPSSGQWSQLGADIDGADENYRFGTSVSMSENGLRIAIGARLADGVGSFAGHVQVFEWNGNNWIQLGDDIEGEARSDRSGTSVSISANGERVAIGAPENDGVSNNAGHVRVYEWNGNTWNQLGDDIDGENGDDRSGTSVSLSANGQIVAIGAIWNDVSTSNDGHVRVFEWNGSNWAQIGDDIDGEAAEDFSGTSVSLSANGQIVAIGATGNDDAATEAGHVRVYEWSNNSWNQLGDDIDGEAKTDESGTSVSISANGRRVAIGAPFYDATTSHDGHVRIYEWNGNEWSQLGNDINGEMSGDWSGTSVAISADGKRVAIGAPSNDDSALSAGHVRVYEWNGTEWSLLGNDIDGEAELDHSGRSVSLSANGARVAVGADLNSGNGDQSGHVRVYEGFIPLPIPTLAQWGIIILGIFIITFGVLILKTERLFRLKAE